MSDKIKPHGILQLLTFQVVADLVCGGLANIQDRLSLEVVQKRLQQLGWREIEVVDEDLGRSAAGTVTRRKFGLLAASESF